MKRKHILGRASGITLLALLSLFINQYFANPDSGKQEVHNQNDSNIMEVHFIDVGQGDSILIEIGDSAMLIDAGENNQGSTVVKYLQSQDIDHLDYVIGTHPHSDHIGGLDTVIDSIPVENIILPQVAHTTKTFEDVLNAVEAAGKQLTKPRVGDTYSLGSATFTIIAPNSEEYEDLNNYSVGIKLNHGNNSFLFTGDAEKLSENEMLKNGIDLSADVLKLGHHGSTNSSSSDFLDAVNPEYAIICAGVGNEYGHPHVEILQDMLDLNIKIYRTDLQGTVVFTSDGRHISVNAHEYIVSEEDLLRDK